MLKANTMNMSATTTKVKMACHPSMTTGSRNCSSYNIRDKLITAKLFKLEDETVVLTDIIDSPLRRRNARKSMRDATGGGEKELF